MLSLETTRHVNQNFPIIQQLWNSILKFPSVLTRLIEETLRDAELSLNVCFYLVIIYVDTFVHLKCFTFPENNFECNTINH